MKPLLEDLREAAAEAARRMDDLGPTTPQHVVDAARAEARALGLQYFRYLRSLETPEARAEREVTLARSRLRELHERRRAYDEGRAVGPFGRAICSEDYEILARDIKLAETGLSRAERRLADIVGTA